MKIAAVIAEYNPFHNGHKYQIDKAKQLLGDDTAIVAVMSGNFTQRGELAIADKAVRAEAALECGVDLVLELPHPYSMSSAEFFAKSGVHIIEK
ncbi:MAG: nucleotidyltransferase family protein, partial [Clostridia bacterium]|nr:nucleotidyltransferase family protein [Clostridia bacterium]